jgi:hypothetical protein
MVLMPCGRCCCFSAAPFDALGNPTSVEVDLTQPTSHSYAVAGSINAGSSVFSGSASMAAFSGTYSLALTATNHWEYEDAAVWVVFDRVGGSNPFQALVVVPKVDFSGTETTSLGTATRTAKGATGGSVLRSCDATPANTYTSNAHERILSGSTWLDTATYDIGFGDAPVDIRTLTTYTTFWRAYYEARPRVGDYDPALRLPFTVTSQAGIYQRRGWSDTYTETSNTFPLYNAPTPGTLADYFVFYYFEYQFSIDAVRLVYSGSTVGLFSEPYPTATGFSWT